MSHSARLIATLKRLLKARGVTYRQLAPKLALSEASVKRIFAEEDFTLERLERICEAAGTDLPGLIQLTGQAVPAPQSHLTMEQEKALAADHALFALFHLLLGGDTPEKIRRAHKLSSSDMTRLLLALDRLGVIELHPGGRVRLRVPRLVRWMSDGPLAAKYVPALRREFFASPFTAGDEYVRLLWARMSRRVRARIERKITSLVREIEETVELEAIEEESDRATPFAVLLAYRPLDLQITFSSTKRR